MLKNEIKQEHAPGDYGIDHNGKDDLKIEEELIQAYNCEEGGTANAKRFLSTHLQSATGRMEVHMKSLL